uniref:Centrosomal protein POC5 n=1 Tax=Ciona intestinalis TaxID=7719 RepID=F6WN20_CIOIN|nr:centrosomal protein POC5 [Ciona intestinalis]XP_026691867.1 centrosomal protein POC5 [Ciona intestinalis]|eukprot:XP_002130350.1 centrosomal protein POC5 [Ciona intestinalis]
MASSTDSDNSLLIQPDSSRGSSVSSGLQEEYDELLKYAIVTPKLGQLRSNEQIPLPQLRIPPEPVTTVHEYSDSSNHSRMETDSLASGRDSAMGSDELETERQNRPKPSNVTSILGGTTADKQASINQMEKSTHGDNMMQLSNKIEKWNEEYRNKILNEVDAMRLNMEESLHQKFHSQEKEFHNTITTLQNEVESLQELLHTYESSLKRKDIVISNLTRALHTSKEKQEMMRVFSQWKTRLVDEKRLNFTSKLARQHWEHSLKTKSWRSWRMLVEGGWKRKVEQACQLKAQEVCVQLTRDYEAKVDELSQSLENSRSEISKLEHGRRVFEEDMKKAFMRSVCALNLEAMTMFQTPESEDTSRDENIPDVTEDRDVTGMTQNIQPSVTEKPKQPPTEVRRNVRLIQPTTNNSDMTSHNSSRQPRDLRGHAVLVKRHHPNIQNYQTQQKLCHVEKQPNTPVRSISSKWNTGSN